MIARGGSAFEKLKVAGGPQPARIPTSPLFKHRACHLKLLFGETRFHGPVKEEK
jgi:hypothetical protein